MSDHLQDGLERGREALRRFLVGDDDLPAMLTKIVRVAQDTVPGCSFASITMVRDGKPMTSVFTDQAALELDELQYDYGDGPCLAAIRHQGIEHVDTAADSRWPDLSAAARNLAVTAVLSAPLMNGEDAVGGLNLYSRTVSAFDCDAQETTWLFADQLGVAAARAAAYAESYVRAQQLQQALESRSVIEQAKGVLMAQTSVGPDDAFEMLKRASQHQNRKLRAIAEEIVARYLNSG